MEVLMEGIGMVKSIDGHRLGEFWGSSSVEGVDFGCTELRRLLCVLGVKYYS